MPVIVSFQPTVPDDADLVAVGVRSDRLEEDAADADPAFLAALGFTGKVAQTLLVSTLAGDAGAEDADAPGPGAAGGGNGQSHGPLRLLIGLGPAADVGPAELRRAGAALVGATQRHRRVATTLLDAVADGRPAAAEALTEGIALAGYRYTAYKDPDPETRKLAEVVVAGKGGKPVAAAIARASAVADAVLLARDLVNAPGGDLTPVSFAERAVEVGSAAGLDVEVLDLAAIRSERLGGLLGVNRGSTQEPRFLRITHQPERPRGSLALVGKGITFDSGGLSLKTADGMIGMKGDMGGAAAVLAAMTLVPVLNPRVKVVAYVPLTDNMPGPDAMRVGDVLRMRNGKTVEVLNTDAEGRLVLADALSLASEDEPDAIVDLATLTGACMVALGPRIAGRMTNHAGWGDQVQAAADAAGEDIWPLPLPEHLRPTLDSDIADLRNIGTGRWGGTLTAGLFLREFVAGDIPWVHLDIAGPAYGSEAHDEVPKNGTGFGVRTLARVLRDWKKPAR
ncbi:MAG: leucyl aminopeptidase [Acidimicrobiales bacterium]|nr:leucyl aminopeptidase [Acidimicrobiales bacterium]